MPKLLFFVPCQKVIVDEQEHSASVISIIEGLTAILPTPIPEKAQIPLNWSIVTLWYQLPEDEGKSFEQRTAVILPNGETAASAVIPFQMGQQNHRNVVSVFGYPIAQSGQHVIRLELREVGDDSREWQLMSEYPLTLAHKAGE